MFLVGFVSINICSTKGSVRTNMILEISTPHEAVSHQLHHTITEEPVKNRNTSQKRNHKTWKLTRITAPQKKSKIQKHYHPSRLSGYPVGCRCLPNVLRIWEHFLSTAETHRFHFSCLRGAILKPQCWKVIFLFSEDTVDGSEIPRPTAWDV